MLTYEEALALVLEHSQPLRRVERPLADLLGYALAEPAVARLPMPQFDNSAVDGYGVLLSDTREASEAAPAKLRLSGEIQAGAPGDLSLSAGCALKILTGGVVPATVDAVVMREYCQEKTGSILVGYAPKQGENIRRKGDEFPAGTEVLPVGQRVTPPVVGLLASLGYASFPVREKPAVAIIATGDELVPPGHPLAPGQIYDSNSYALQAAVKALGIEKSIILHAQDTPESTRAAFEQAIKEYDVVLSAGGVSVGDYDYVKDVLEKELHVKTIFWKIAIKPGKPVYFGVANRTDRESGSLVFGLPGNPVSALVTYHQLVKPALLKLLGVASNTQRMSGTLRAELKKKPGRLDFVRAVAEVSQEGVVQVQPTRGQDSHMMSGLARANSLIHFPAEADRMADGSAVVVDRLDWSQ
jgi:molybdopterin molybdotransferase